MEFKTLTFFNLHSQILILGPIKNRASIDGGMAQGFAAALAAQQPARHERYAAHIPVPSGRQSVTSVDSVNRSALVCFNTLGAFFKKRCLC